MQYKGYLGKAEFDDEAGIVQGAVINTRDVITFEGRQKSIVAARHNPAEAIVKRRPTGFVAQKPSADRPTPD